MPVPHRISTNRPWPPARNGAWHCRRLLACPASLKHTPASRLSHSRRPSGSPHQFPVGFHPEPPVSGGTPRSLRRLSSFLRSARSSRFCLALSHSAVSSFFPSNVKSRPPVHGRSPPIKHPRKQHARTLTQPKTSARQPGLIPKEGVGRRFCSSCTSATTLVSSHLPKTNSPGPFAAHLLFPISIADISRPPRQTVTSPTTWLPHS